MTRFKVVGVRELRANNIMCCEVEALQQSSPMTAFLKKQYYFFSFFNSCTKSETIGDQDRNERLEQPDCCFPILSLISGDEIPTMADKSGNKVWFIYSFLCNFDRWHAADPFAFYSSMHNNDKKPLVVFLQRQRSARTLLVLFSAELRWRIQQWILSQISQQQWESGDCNLPI